MKNKLTLNLKLVLALAIFILLFDPSAAQTTANPERGLYVNNFFALTNNNPRTVSQQFSILCSGTFGAGNVNLYAKEEELLTYAQNHHFTYLVLYDLGTVFSNAGLTVSALTLTEHLKRFIRTARSDFGITKIGANIGGVDNSDEVIFYNANRSSSPGSVYFTSAQLTSSNPVIQDLDDFIGLNLPKSDVRFEAQQATKLFLQIQSYTANANERIDVLSIEFEFWNAGYPYDRFQQITERMNDVKVIAPYTLESEIYVARFQADDQPALTSKDIADYLDRLNANGNPYYNRIMLTYYRSNPPGSYASQSSRLTDLASAGVGVTTNPSTNIFPLFSTGLLSTDPNFGDWMKLSSINNLYAAERIYYNEFHSAGATSNSFTNCKNIWYPSSTQAVPDAIPSSGGALTPLAQKIDVVYANGPICTTGSTGTPTFTYNGPCEQNVGVKAWVQSASGSTYIYGSASSYALTAAFTTGKALADVSNIALSVGDYVLHSELNYQYASGSHTYTAPDQNLKIVSSISSLTPTLANNQGTTTICEGTPLILRAIDGHAQWYKKVGTSGTFVSQGTSQELIINSDNIVSSIVPAVNSEIFTYHYVMNGSATCAIGQTSGDIVITAFKNPTFTFSTAISAGSCNNSATFGVTGDLGINSGNTGCSYVWSNGSSTSSISVSRVQKYKVIQTTNQGCQRIDSETPNFAYQCDNATLNLCSGSIYPAGSSIQSLATNSTISLQTNYTLPTGTTSLIGVTLSGATNTILTVPSGATLKLYGCTLTSCGNSWGGVFVQNGGRIETYSNGAINTLIEHATTGIQLESTAQYSLQNTIFNRCQTSLFLNLNQIGGLIKECEFNCLSINGTPTGLLKNTNIISAGINAQGSTLTLSSTGVGNKFNHLVSGVNADVVGVVGSIVTIPHTTFTDIKDPSSPGTAKAVNVTGANSSLSLTSASFSNCEIGASTTNSGGTVVGNTFTNCPRAISITSPNSKSVKINYNNISNTLNGITVLFADLAARLEINSNIITDCGSTTAPANSNTSYGIQVDGNGANNNNFYSLITSNSVTLISTGKAISLTYKNKAFVVHNNITLQNGNLYAQKGISMETCKNFPVVSCNYVSSTTPGMATNHYGLFFSANEYPTITCNTSVKSGSGFRFENDNKTVKLLRNEMVNNHYGLDLYSNAFITNQDHRSNLWIGSFTLAGNNTSSIQGNLIQVYPTSDTRFLPTAANVPQWIKAEPTFGERACNGEHYGIGNTTYTLPYLDCATPSTVPPSSERIAQVDVSDSIILIDSLKAKEYMAETNFIARQRLYSRLLENPEMMENNNLVQQFFDESELESWVQPERIRIDEVNYDDATSSIRFNMEQNYAMLDYYQALIISNDTIRNDSLRFVQNEQIYSQIESINISNELLSNLLNNSEQTRILLLQNANASLTGSSLIEQNQIVINEIYLRTIAVGDYKITGETLSQIEEIAHQCPHSGGMGVYLARNILALVSPNEYYDDLPACLLNGYFRKPETQKDLVKEKKVSYFSFSPNPASNFVSASYFITEGANAELIFYNSLMQVVKKVALDDSKQEQRINCSEFNSGVYLYSLKIDQRIIKQGKLSIVN